VKKSFSYNFLFIFSAIAAFAEGEIPCHSVVKMPLIGVALNGFISAQIKDLNSVLTRHNPLTSGMKSKGHSPP
jgi:hypothetical protein